MTRPTLQLFVSILLVTAKMAFAEVSPLATEAQSASAFRFLDRRPNSASANSQQKDIQRATTTLGDDCVTPAAPEIFKSWMTRKFFDQLPGTTVVLTELTIETMDVPVAINNAEFLSRANETVPTANPLAILLARMLVGGIENLRGKTLLTVRVAGEIDGRHFSGASAETFRGRVSEENIKSVLAEAAEGASAKMRAALTLR